MNAIIVMLVSAVVAAPFLALSGMSAPAPRIVRRFGASRWSDAALSLARKPA